MRSVASLYHCDWQPRLCFQGDFRLDLAHHVEHDVDADLFWCVGCYYEVSLVLK